MSLKPVEKVDIQQMLGLTWKPGKIALQTGVVIAAYLVWLFFSWLAPETAKSAWAARIILFAGDLLIYFILLAGLTKVAGSTLADLGLKSSGSAGGEILKSPLKIFAVIAGLAAIHIVIDLVGKIPYLGELCWMFSPVFTVPIAVGIVFAFLGLIFGLMLLPVIIALGKEGPVSVLIDFIRKHTLRFLGHFLIALTAAVVIVVLLGAALNVTSTLSTEFLGRKYTSILANVPNWTRTCPVNYPWFGFYTDATAGRWTMVLAGFVFGLLHWLIRMAIAGVVLVNFCVAGTVSYLSLEGIPEEETPVEPGTKPGKPRRGRARKQPAEEKAEPAPAETAPPAPEPSAG